MDYPFVWSAILPSSGVLFLKSTLLFGYIAKLQSPHSYVANSKLVIWLFCKIAKSTSKMSFKLITIQKKFWAVQGMNFLSWSVETSAPKKPDDCWFFFNFISTGCLHPPPPKTPFSFSLLSSYFCRLDDSLKINRSPFKFQTTLYIIFWTYWEQICVNLEIAELDSIVLILPSNNPCFFFLLNL